MAALIDAIEVKRKMFFEFENTPFLCLEAVVNTPTARGGQTLVRLKMRNLLTNAVKFVAPGTKPRIKIRAEAVADGEVSGVRGQGSGTRAG